MPASTMLATTSTSGLVGPSCRPRRQPFAGATLQRGCGGGIQPGPCQPSSSMAFLAPSRMPSRSMASAVHAVEDDSNPVKYNKQFGYSRKDIIIITGGLIGLGYAMYYGLQAMGMEAGIAGNWVQMAIFLGICVGYVSTYVFRVATKQMTYVKQLEAYEDAVMRKRVEEMTEAELEQLVKEADSEKARKAAQTK